MDKRDEQIGDLSLSATDFLAWRVMRGKERQQHKHKKRIVTARPRQRSETHATDH